MKKKTIIHVIDNRKFIPSCKATFEIKQVSNLYFTSSRFVEDVEVLKSADLLIIHFLDHQLSVFLNRFVTPVPVVWFLWGGEISELGKFYNKILFRKTKILRIRLAFRKNFNLGLRTLAKTTFPQLYDNDQASQILIKSFRKIDVIVPVVPGDYTLLKKNYKVNSSMFHLNYANPLVEEFQEQKLTSNNILLGNSATFSGNHLEAIDRLATIDLKKRKVIIPLSYGDEIYGNYIRDYAKRRLRSNAQCLIDFLPYEDYQKILLSCSVVIMNHLRQQALGNIVQAIMNGTNIYLNKSTTVYTYLKEKGFIISEMSDLQNLKELSEEEIIYNRAKCIDVFGVKQQHKKVQELINISLGLEGHQTAYNDLKTI